ncbi:ABC transporter permease [Microbacterium sp. G2-8]|uniref:ABC transporter permease n=1 Tax=Microbacterium sp. G2-8 TaxID=2842454 RepID=UPI001C8A55E8|nr:ABC transporter permease [Microbacterium sp. G2-8]
MSARRTGSGGLLQTLRGPNGEGVLALIIIVLVVVMAILSPAFFDVRTLFSILRSVIVPLIFALAVLLIIISGGIDVSFAAIAVFAGYTTVFLLTQGSLDPGLIVIMLLAIVIGAALGAVNGIVIARFRLPTLIVTLGTQGIFKGVLLAYVGSRYIAEIPDSLASLSTAYIISIESAKAYLHVLVIPAALLAVGMWALLTRTMFGRGVYAIGGDAESARRAGIPVMRYQVMLYMLAGMLAATGGIFYVILNRNADPQVLVGDELDIIAAVVLGGASIFGGRGSVLGTVLGVFLVQLINNSLLLLGVPTAWQRTAVGLLLVIGVGVQAISARRQAKRVKANDEAIDIDAKEVAS